MAQVGALYRGEIKNWKAVGDFDQARLPLRPAVQLRHLRLHAGVRPRQQELLDRHEGDERQRPDHRGRPPGRGRRRLRRRRLPLRRDGPGPQGPQGPRDLQGARRDRLICRPTRPPSTPATTRSPGPSTWPPTASPRATPPSSWPVDRRPRGPGHRRRARASSRSARASTRPPTTRTSSELTARPG
ncbi:MAG: hypothetical protein M0C28_48965 [Candidatus Moduliflexus flocculans]|nr:hypothetical protein [Candidatus Moduliflexus flocculans]